MVELLHTDSRFTETLWLTRLELTFQSVSGFLPFFFSFVIKNETVMLVTSQKVLFYVYTGFAWIKGSVMQYTNDKIYTVQISGKHVRQMFVFIVHFYNHLLGESLC